MTLLHFACKEGHWKVVEWLVDTMTNRVYIGDKHKR